MGCGVWGVGCGVWGVGCGVWDVRCRMGGGVQDVECGVYRGTPLIRTTPLLGPCSRTNLGSYGGPRGRVCLV